MTPTQKKVQKALKAIIADLRGDLSAKGINAHGTLSKSLRDEINGNRGEIYGLDYFRNVVFGQKANEVQQSYPELVKDLLDWVEAPKFAGMSLPDRQGLAYGTAKNILRRGTLRGRSTQYPGLAADQIFKKHTEKLKPEIFGDLRAVFV